jgi:hypothetical protein
MDERSKYKDVDWQAELDEYFSLGDYPIRAFTRSKEYSYYAFKNRLYKDPRYHGRNSNWNRPHVCLGAGDTVFLPVKIEDVRSSDIRVNGFTVTVDETTDEVSLKKLLTVMRDM